MSAMSWWKVLASALALGLVALAAHAGPVGERHLVTTDSTAALRDAEHRSQVRVTVWYPAPAGSPEQSIDQGPPGKPMILEGAVAPDAPFADNRRRPVILLSHGFGGAARSMAWFGVALARAGYVVIAPDHPGNNGLDKMTAAGAVLSWDRVDDLKAALDSVLADPAIGPHIDRTRLGVAGFSAGGYTSLIAAGARASPDRLGDFCRAHPRDGICMPQKELALSLDDAIATLRSPALAGETARAGDDRSIPGIRAVFTIAPAIVQELTPESLRRIRPPVAIVLGDADPIAPPATNGLVAAKLIPNVQLKVLPGVGHYDFVGVCTPAGRAAISICNAKVPQGPTLQAAVDMALAFFARRLGAP
jgi:predicted dienelactone hydrolase